MSNTQALAEFVVQTHTDAIPAQVLAGAGNAILDTVGCALGAVHEPLGEPVLAWLRETGARERSTVWGHTLRTSPADAAFANGVFSHALDFDDSLPSLRGHPSAPMTSALLAVGEATHATGKDTLAAFALGLEVAGCLGRAISHDHYLRGWHTTATIGALSSATVAARLWKLDALQLQTAWGLAASQVSGLVRNFGTMTKPFHAGHAARAGVMSAWLASHGFTASTAIFDGENNFFDTYGGPDSQDLGELIARLGRPWEMTEPGIYVKRWPCCYCNHRPVAGILQLLADHAIGASEILGIEVGFLPGSDSALISKNPQSGLEGKFSIEYVAAATVLDRRLTSETFTDEQVQRPAVRAMMEKVRRYRIEDSKVYSGVVGYTDVAIITGRGRFETRVDKTPGSAQAPLTADEYNEKFLGNATIALGDRQARALLDQLRGLSSLDDVSILAQATVPR